MSSAVSAPPSPGEQRFSAFVKDAEAFWAAAATTPSSPAACRSRVNSGTISPQQSAATPRTQQRRLPPPLQSLDSAICIIGDSGAPAVTPVTYLSRPLVDLAMRKEIDGVETFEKNFFATLDDWICSCVLGEPSALESCITIRATRTPVVSSPCEPTRRDESKDYTVLCFEVASVPGVSVADAKSETDALAIVPVSSEAQAVEKSHTNDSFGENTEKSSGLAAVDKNSLLGNIESDIGALILIWMAMSQIWRALVGGRQ